MPTYTEYLQLYKPSRSDQDVEVDTSLQQNFEKIDQELKLQAEQIFQQTGDGVPGITEEYMATEGQTVFPLATTYQMGVNALTVEIDGVPQRLNEGYTETSVSSITIAEPLIAGQIVTININKNPFEFAKDVTNQLAKISTEVFQIGTTQVEYDENGMVKKLTTPTATITYEFTNDLLTKETEVRSDQTIQTTYVYEGEILKSFQKAVI